VAGESGRHLLLERAFGGDVVAKELKAPQGLPSDASGTY